MRLFNDSEEQVEGFWSFSPQGSPMVPVAHAFGSSVWDAFPQDIPLALGEADKGQWRSGIADPRYSAINYCGSDDVWINGVSVSQKGKPPSIDGFPICCEQEVIMVPVGGILMYGGTGAIPNGYLLCDGSFISRTEFSGLFDIIGTTFGIGDGSTTFALPDFASRSPLGSGWGSGLSLRTIGEKGGEENHTLSISELAIHSHDLTLAAVTTNPPPAGPPIQSFSDMPLGLGGISGSEGDSHPHNNMQPFLCVRFIIKT